MINIPYLKSFEEEGGVKYQYNVKSGLSYKDTVGLRLQINRVDSGLNVRIADLDYYWLQERGLFYLLVAWNAFTCKVWLFCIQIDLS